MIAELERLAREEMGEDATALDYACHYIEEGGRLTELRKLVGEGIGEVSRNFFSIVLKGLAPDAKTRMDAARKASAPALVEIARDIIADAPTSDRVKWERAKEEAATNKWLAERYGKETYGQQQPVAQVNLNVGDLHLSAFRAIGQPPSVVEIPAPAQAEVLQLPPGETPTDAT